MREATLIGQARAYYALMSTAERSDVRHRLARIERAPWPDDQTIFAVPGTPDFCLYDDGDWRLFYAILDEATILVRSITHVLDLHD
jgi:hypothetical protein